MHDLPKPSLPRVLRWLNSRHPDVPALEPAEILAAVESNLGSFVLPERVHSALELWCRSINRDSNLHFFGRTYVRSVAVSGLMMRVRLDRLLERRPELCEVPLRAPLIVVGLQRSGTTYLHRLLCETDGARPLPLWEAMRPIPPRRGPDLRRLQVALAFYSFRWAAPPTLDSMHYMRPMLADECQFLLRLDFRSPVFWTPMAAFEYGEWLFREEMTESYQMYRRLLQVLQAATPGRRLVLKSPGHTLHLRELLAAVPEAHVVQTHRDPLQTLPSLCKLTLTAQSAFTRGVDPVRVVDTVTDFQGMIADRSVAVRESAAGREILDVDYRELLADPVAVVGEIHRRFGLDQDDALERRIRSHARQNRQHKHGRSEYTLEQFGLTRTGVEQRFADYRARFIGPRVASS